MAPQPVSTETRVGSSVVGRGDVRKMRGLEAFQRAERVGTCCARGRVPSGGGTRRIRLFVTNSVVISYACESCIKSSSFHTCSGNSAPERTGAQTVSSNYRPTRKESGHRRSATGGETVIESRQGQGVARAEAEKRAQDQQGGDRRDIRRTHVPLGK